MKAAHGAVPVVVLPPGVSGEEFHGRSRPSKQSLGVAGPPARRPRKTWKAPEGPRYCEDPDCRALLVRGPREDNTRWARRRYCGKSCAGRVNGRKASR